MNDRLVQWVCSGNTVGWSVQERYRGGLNWIFEEVGLSVGGLFLGLRVPVWIRDGVDAKRKCNGRTPFSESLGLTSLGLQGVLLRNSANVC